MFCLLNKKFKTHQEISCGEERYELAFFVILKQFKIVNQTEKGHIMTHSTSPVRARLHRRLLSAVSTMCLMLLVSTPALAGTSGSTMGQGVTSMIDEVIAFLTGPIVIGGATIMFILALVGGYFAGGNDTIKKVLTIAAITAAIIAAPGIVMQVVNAAGAVI